MLKTYFASLYRRTMTEAYALGHREMAKAMAAGGRCLDCGASSGEKFELLRDAIGLQHHQYAGIEWSAKHVDAARSKGMNVTRGDLNAKLEFADASFRCIFGLSVLEHLLNPCRFLRECHRCLEDDGTLVILTPNISTFFTMALLLAGKMPSSGPHPDSDALLRSEEVIKVSHVNLQPDSELDTPVHRHLVVFSYRVLNSYLRMLGFRHVEGHGFGLYPFPNFTQRVLERIDPYHCHQMVFIARK